MRLPSWLTRPITALEYLLASVVLFVVQYPLHEAIAHAHGHNWGLLSYVWPLPSDPMPSGHEPHEMWLVLFWASMPFTLVGASLAARRFADAKVAKLWALLALLPLVDRLVMIVALLLPSHRVAANAIVHTPYRDAELGPVPQSRPTLMMKLLPRTTLGAFIISCLLTSVVTYGSIVTLYEDGSGRAALFFLVLPFFNAGLVGGALTYGKDTSNKQVAIYLLIATAAWIAAASLTDAPGLGILIAFVGLVSIPGGGFFGAQLGRFCDTHVRYEIPVSTRPNHASSGSGSSPDWR